MSIEILIEKAEIEALKQYGINQHSDLLDLYYMTCNLLQLYLPTAKT